MLPCATCPWRVDKDAIVIPRYSHEKACGLKDTVGEGDAFRPIMACHHSTEADMYACNGYLAVVGWTNINVRLLLAKGQLPNPDAVWAACSLAGIKLHKNYDLVLKKLARSVRKSVQPDGRRL
jgi:hypothetical protein